MTPLLIVTPLHPGPTALNLHPTDGGVRYTLRGLFTEEAVARRKMGDLEGQGFQTLLRTEAAPSGTFLFHVAAQHYVIPARRSGIPQDHSPSWEATRMALKAFRRIARRAGGAGGAFRWYKGLDVETLHRCVSGFNWSGSYRDVAAGILSTTILTHPFPNANHRCAIYLARTYLASAGVQWPSYNLAGRGVRRFARECTPFIVRSKYLLQVRRHAPLIRIAFQEGYRSLIIGSDSQVPIRVDDLTLSTKEVRRRHRMQWARAIDHMADAETTRHLGKPNAQTLRGWVRWTVGRPVSP